MIVAPEDIVRFVPAEEIAKYIPEDVIRKYVLPNAEIHVGFQSGLSQPGDDGKCNKKMRSGELCKVKWGHKSQCMSAAAKAKKALASRRAHAKQMNVPLTEEEEREIEAIERQLGRGLGDFKEEIVHV